MRCHKGFTRVDFVVTLLCAAFLIMTMGAVGNRGRRRAQQLVCASQLAKWGQAIFMHSADNGDNLMFMIRRWPPEGPFPQLMSSIKEYGNLAQDYQVAGGEEEGEWNAWGINPYIDCIDKNFDENGIASEIMTCPNCSGEFMQEWIWWQWRDRWTYFDIAYSYWVIGGVRPPIDIGTESSPDIARDLTLDTLSAKRLLMTEILNIDDAGGWNSLRYNHGLTGWSWGMGWAMLTGPPLLPPGHMKVDGQQDATGRNQLFGDGRVQWRPISLEFEDNLPSGFAEGFYENEWNGPGSGWIDRYNPSYY